MTAATGPRYGTIDTSYAMTLGSSLVFACGLGLISYGVFCVASHRHRTINDNESD